MLPTDHDRDKMIALLKEGICPVCGRGKFKNPLQHTRQAHGISSKELKDLLLVSRHTGFADAELSEKQRNKAIKMNSASIMLEKRPTYNVVATNLSKRKFAKTIEQKLTTPEYKKYMLDKVKIAQKVAHVAKRIGVVRVSVDEGMKVYESLIAAAKDNGVTPGAIRYAIDHKTKSAGYKWKLIGK